MLIFEPFSVVVVPFPFTDRDTTKKRPALVLSNALFSASVGHSILAMITDLNVVNPLTFIQEDNSV